MPMRLLVDSDEFWSAFSQDVATATKRVYLQMMTCEGDAAGEKLTKALLSSRAPDKRLVVDNFTKHVINDKFLWSPLNQADPALRREVWATKQMFRTLEDGGVRVRWTHPVGFLLRKFPSRNHKKIYVVDDEIAYVGGINFSDHNFTWHDMMIRIQDPRVAEFLSQDLLATWAGTDQSACRSFGPLAIHLLDGQNNTPGFRPVLDFIDRAQKSIFVLSPYLCSPFTEGLIQASKRGVQVTVITPEHNNSVSVREHLKWLGSRHGLDIRLYPERMLHLKAMLIDDRVLVSGSSNFDYVSYNVESELLLITDDADLIEDFKQRVLSVDLAVAKPPQGKMTWLQGARYCGQLWFATRLVVMLCRL